MRAGDKILSKIANWLIATPFLYNIMKVFAKQAMKRSAEVSRGGAVKGGLK